MIGPNGGHNIAIRPHCDIVPFQNWLRRSAQQDVDLKFIKATQSLCTEKEVSEMNETNYSHTE